jgi:pimeloyl-ACP methyl ester carboxylesterase
LKTGETGEKMETIFNSPGKFASNFTTVNGYKTHYLEAGEKDAGPLLLVHGSSCEIGMGLDRWYPTILPLAGNFHVYAVDELGHGETDSPRNIDDLGHVRVRADHVIDFIDSLNIGPVNLVGQSQGGWIVTYFTLKRPDLVKRLVMIDSGSTAGAGLTSEGLPFFEQVFESGTMVPKHNLKTRDGIRDYVSVFLYDKSMVSEDLLDRLMVLSGKWNDLYMANIREFWRQRGVEKKAEMYSVDGRHISEWVETIRVPTLVVWGKHSNKGLQKGIELYQRIPDAQMHIFDKANHFVWLDQPKEFNSLVTWFLKKD